MNFTQYVDPFYGNFEPTLPKPEGVAAKWFFLKAQAGNTLPAAVRPFGMVSACAYTGGYPTGYGPYLSNSHGQPPRMMEPEAMTALGFSHFHQSGTGYIVQFYNFSILTPVVGTRHRRFDRYPLTAETARPGYYSCRLGEVKCETTVTASGALYRFRFPSTGENMLVLDPVLNGIFKDLDTPAAPLGEAKAVVVTPTEVTTAVTFGDSTLHTALFCKQGANATHTEDGRVLLTVQGDVAEVALGFSFANAARAAAGLKKTAAIGFQMAKQQAEALWDKALSVVEIDGDEARCRKFYSNLYRCFVKPICMTGNAPYGIEGDCYMDLATMWDVSKTQLPLLFTLFGGLSSELVNSFLNSYDRLGFFPNAFLLTGCEGSSNTQARALTVNSIYDAYLRGVEGVDWHHALECMMGEMHNAVNEPFFHAGEVSEYPSQVIDLAIAAFSIAGLAAAIGEEAVAKEYAALAEKWQDVYDPATGALKTAGKFYEGCHLNYSFRLLPDMDKRIALAGGPEKFEAMLDAFFGWDLPDAVQCVDPNDRAAMAAGEARRGFEGFNNETDMETPYNYCYIGRADKACAILRAGEDYMYGTEGRGALCGNEDSGAMSSLYVVNALGIFPCFGQDRVALGCPTVKAATLHLANGNTLRICRESEGVAPNSIRLNGEVLMTPFVTVGQLMAGGELVFEG